MSTFAVSGKDPQAVLDAVNHLLATQGQGGGGSVDTGNTLQVNTKTGAITSGAVVVSYLYQYMIVRYATSADGSTGFSTSPTNATYYGLYNNASQTPSDIANPTSYQWQQVTGGFGTTKFLWYVTYGGRQVSWFVGTTTPGASYAQVTNNVPVDLDFVTATASLPLVILNTYQRANTAPALPTGGTYDFNTLTFTPPAGWAASIPAGNIPVYSSQNQFQSPVAGGAAPPTGPWTLPIVFTKEGANGVNGTNGANGISTVNYNVFQSANTTPGTPSGGTYNFGTSTGTPPAGWSNTPVSANGAPIWASTASLSSSDPAAIVNIGTAWTPTFQYTGAGGAQGTRGFVPMGYVLTPSNPIGASTVQLAAWFGASRDNTVAPIGMGTPPITNDTACFTDATNSANNVVYTFDGTTNTWTQVKGTVVNGNVFVTGSVNAAAMNANDIYGLTMRGGTVTVGTNAGTGFWLQASTGNAYIGGNTYIGNTTTVGNNLIVGNNAYIGGNLTVAGLITGNGSGATLNSNTVNTGQVVASAVSGGIGTDSGTFTTFKAGAVAGTSYATDLTVSIPTIQANQDCYIWSGILTGLNITTFPAGSVVNLFTSLYRKNPDNTQTLIASDVEVTFAGASTQSNYEFYIPVNFTGFLDNPPQIGTQTYTVYTAWTVQSGPAPTGVDLVGGYRSLLVQTLKR